MAEVKYRVYKSERRDIDYVEFDVEPTEEQYAAAAGVGEVEVITPQPRSREEVFSKISEAHSRIYRELWTERNYESAWEVVMYANLPGNKYQTEAQGLVNWRVQTWELIESADITGETDENAFINSLPKFQLPV